MKFQLVLQFPAANTNIFNMLVALEDELTRNLRLIAEIDGHDFGGGEFNIFVLTDQPKGTFVAAHVLIRQRHLHRDLKAAYREIDKDEYVILWPSGLSEFTIA